MFYNVLKAKDLVSLKEEKMDREVLMENGDSSLTIMALKKDEIIDTHTSIADAFFETMSGFTTTGATILDNIESLPKGLLFWRSFTQWIGGLGIVLFTIASLPLLSGICQLIFLSVATGVTQDKILP